MRERPLPHHGFHLINTPSMIREFKNQTSGREVLKLIGQMGSNPCVDCLDLRGFAKVTGDCPICAFVSRNEVLILMIDWSDSPGDELADEELDNGGPAIYFGSDHHRPSPVGRLFEFTRLYKQAMSDEIVPLRHVWSVLVSNSYFFNADDMQNTWAAMEVTVYHGLGHVPMPVPSYTDRYHVEGQKQFKAFRIWCEEHENLANKPYAFENTDADDVSMESGLDGDLGGEADNLFDTDFSDMELSQYPEGSVVLNQNNVINMEILKPLRNPRQELDKLIGCQGIKSQISDLIALSRYNRCMNSLYPGWKQHNISLHAIFLGRPGTGKTTVCKIYGSLLHEAGMLSKGHVVVCSRSTFIGSNWGDEEKAVRLILEKAQGGVLMIDEAYLLNSGHPNDPAKLVLPMLMDILSNEQQRDLAVVLCGYKEPMERLLGLNAGLAFRFPNRFEFKDFTVGELLEITRRRISDYNYRFTRAAWVKYRQLLESAYARRDTDTWGNARFVANQLEHIYLAHAKRCMRQPQKSTSFLVITPADIQPIEVARPQRRIGF